MKVQTIVVGFDGSPNANQALQAAIALVAPDGVVHVVTAFHMPSAGETSQMLRALPKEFRDHYDPLQAPRAFLGDAQALLKASGVNEQSHFVEEHPADAILQVADDVDADLIVVGSRGLSRGTRFLRGSVSSRVATHAKTSFLVIHEDE